MGLALDVRLRRFALGIERVEVLFEPVLGGFAMFALGWAFILRDH